MASKLGILLVAFLSIISLPLLSAFIHPIPGLAAHRHRHRHRHHHRLFRPRFFPLFGNGLEHANIGNGDDNERAPIFLNPALEKEPRKHEEANDTEGRGNGDDNETTPAFSNPALDEGKNGDGNEARGNGDDNETTTFSNPALDKDKNEEPEGDGDDNEKTPTFTNDTLDEQKNEEPQPEEPRRPAERPVNGGLREAFYEESCPQAEKIVNETIQKHFRKDPSLAAAFVRLFFHDCFVTGCDGSVLLDKTPSGEDVEKKALHNGPLVRGFETIDDIKTQLEAACPGVVSCADILAFANRDSLVFTGVPNYAVEAGRRDGLASLAKNVDGNLPTPEIGAEQSIQMFQKKGMSLEDLVVLIGAHSIGSAHCSVVSPRFHDKRKSKEIDPGYLFKMQTIAMCQSEDQVIPFDPYSQHEMDSRYYKEILTNKALLEADHKLAKEARTRNVMEKLVDDQEGWLVKFTAAIKKLGEVEVLTGDQGEIRKQCRAVNGDD